MDDPNSPALEPPSNSVPASAIPLDAASGGATLTLRDDRLDFAGFGDAAASCRRRDARLRLIDQGRFTAVELEWLAEAGTDIYTSDRARSALAEFIQVRKAARRGGAWAVYFHHGPLEDEERPRSVSWEALREMLRSGLDLHISNGAAARDFERLGTLADDAKAGGARLVYYHHGAPAAELETLARRGAWIHVRAVEAAGEEPIRRLAEYAGAARAAGSQVIVHVEQRPHPSGLSDLLDAGAIVLFRTPPSDFRSPLRPLEERARTRRLDPRAFYLFPDYVL